MTIYPDDWVAIRMIWWVLVLTAATILVAMGYWPMILVCGYAVYRVAQVRG